MKVIVNKDACIGCGACEQVNDQLFKIGEDGLSNAVNEIIPEGLEESAQEAIGVCPTSAIEEVGE